MTTRTLLLCCGLLATLSAVPVTPTAAFATTTAIPNANPAAIAFPGSVREVTELIVEAEETLRFKGPVEFRVGGEVRIEGKIIVDGVESTGRPNITIRALGTIHIDESATVQTMSYGHGAHGGSIRLLSAEAINLRGKLAPSAGNDGRAPGQHGGHGGSIELEAPIIRTTLERIEASNAGHGGPAGSGGNGGSVHILGALLWEGDANRLNTILVAGHGGNGGDGSRPATTAELRSGGAGGAGGQAKSDSWRLPEWLEEIAFIEDEDAVRRASYNALEGTDGDPGIGGGPGHHGAEAIGGDGGHGGAGLDAELRLDTEGEVSSILPAGSGGNGGDAGFAYGGQAGAGGKGGSTALLEPDHPQFGAPGGEGGNGGTGGSARSGNGGDGGLGGSYPDSPALPANQRGITAHDGHAGHPAQAMGGHGGHGGHAGSGFGQVAPGGIGGPGGAALPGTGGLSGTQKREAVGEAARRKGHATPGFNGRNGNNGHTLGKQPN